MFSSPIGGRFSWAIRTREPFCARPRLFTRHRDGVTGPPDRVEAPAAAFAFLRGWRVEIRMI